jgi:hypothetical protein
MQRTRARRALQEVGAAVADWEKFAAAAGVPEARAAKIAAAHRLDLVLR